MIYIWTELVIEEKRERGKKEWKEEKKLEYKQRCECVVHNCTSCLLHAIHDIQVEGKKEYTLRNRQACEMLLLDYVKILKRLEPLQVQSIANENEWETHIRKNTVEFRIVWKKNSNKKKLEKKEKKTQKNQPATIVSFCYAAKIG